MATTRNGHHHQHRGHHHGQRITMNRLEITFQAIRIILVILLAIIFIISTIYFIRAIDAIGDDVDEARETHFGHEIEENVYESTRNSRFDPYEDYGDDYNHQNHQHNKKKGGRLIKSGHHHYRVTNSELKQHHIISLIVWVVLTLFCAILSLAGILGAIFLNPCMVLFSAIMILVHAICSHVLPIFHITFPNMTSNWFLLALEVPAITFAILFVFIFSYRQKRFVAQMRQRRILY
ncbi:uncharacterized protein LOC124497131 [Dermatophagoides farinae]|uniref:Uncharacterized protein n=1 Tax=Dermatophagoides farinae TaxID=6954 RepID=A0A922IGL5_DERFA|nr:uncharacterized protein LOC124497131 [Dermatophagoides farinae]KAH7638283.1 hypothetical protein HUG17_9389 [Dermatophagoides farinae]KAH9530295.1 hypothetical protein DERF_004108 [Dermatophagoides farinae]